MGRRSHLREDPHRVGVRGVHHRRLLAHGRRLADLEQSLRSDLAIDALEMAIWNRTRAGQVLDGLVHHSDRGVQYLSIRYTERLADNDIVASVGSRGDSYDNAMAESLQQPLQVGAHLPQGPWRGLDDVEFATMSYIDWFNHRRLHGEITDDNSYTTPAEFEAAYYRQATRPSSRSPNNPAVTKPGALRLQIDFESSRGRCRSRVVDLPETGYHAQRSDAPAVAA